MLELSSVSESPYIYEKQSRLVETADRRLSWDIIGRVDSIQLQPMLFVCLPACLFGIILLQYVKGCTSMIFIPAGVVSSSIVGP